MKNRSKLDTIQALYDAECEKTARLAFAQSLRPFGAIAWTGGSSPAKPSTLPRWQVAYRRALFREQVNTFRRFWGDMPNADTLRIFFRRAAGDAHATFRNAFNS